MRKLSAFILVVPFSILLFGSMSLASFCLPVPQPACTSIQGKCCQKEKSDCPKSDCPKEKKSGAPACCLSCPLCTLVTLPPFIDFQPAHPESTTEYAVRPDNSPTDYYQHHWKPPKPAPLIYI